MFSQNKKIYFIVWGVICVFVPIVSTFIVELSNHKVNMENTFQFLLQNIGLCLLSSSFFLAILLLLVGLSGSWIVGMTSTLLFSILISYANTEKINARSEPVYPDDLAILSQPKLLKTIAGQEVYNIVIAILIIVVLILVGLGIWGFRKSKKYQLLRLSFLGASLLILFSFLTFNQKGNVVRFIYDKIDPWYPTQQVVNYRESGFVGAFFYNYKPVAMYSIPGYSEEKIQEIVNKYTVPLGQKKGEDEEEPNIVFVLSESYSDPMRLNGVNLNKDPILEYRLLSMDAFSGDMFSPGYGGGTGNIEFEVLTGLSLAPLSSGVTSPFASIVSNRKDFPSIVSYLNSHSYETIAIHPYDFTMYRRDRVYPNLGFRTLVNIGTMQFKDHIENNPFISDESAFNQTLQMLKRGNNEDPKFINLVTMQSHMPYSGKYDSLDFSISKQLENKTEIENYSQDIFYGTEALRNFIEQINQLERRTIVVYYGDHLPGIYGKDVLDHNEEIDMHLTPFMIYDSKRKFEGERDTVPIVSPIYFSSLALKDTSVGVNGYYNLLTRLYEVLPAFEKGNYFINGKWEKRIVGKDIQQIYDDYKMIEYDILEGKQYSIKLGFF